MLLALFASGMNAFPDTVMAADGTPVGYWKTIDDEDGKPKSVVKIWLKDQKLYGKIVRLFEDPDAKCKECEGALKDQPVVGMQILTGLEEDGDEWSGGTITDPKNGKTYKCYVELQEGGEKLKVRGYIGISLFGRTQYWHRSSEAEANASPSADSSISND